MGTVLIIGASRGIGHELARQYLQAGQRVIATARDESALQALRDMGAQPLGLDVADAASISALAWQLDGERIERAWHVAGVMCSRANALQVPSQAEFDRVMHANVLGAMQVLSQVAPLLTEVAEAQASGGASSGAAGDVRLAFISSGMGHIGSVEGSNAWLYRTSKAALNMAVAAAQHSYPQVRMVCFHPGWVQTDMGGAQAPLSVAESAAGLRHTLEHLPPPDGRACFMRFDGARYEGW